MAIAETSPCRAGALNWTVDCQPKAMSLVSIRKRVAARIPALAPMARS
jgi:hypothetical protein